MKAAVAAPVVLLALVLPAAAPAESFAEPVVANGRIAFVTGNGMATMNPDGTGVWGLMLTPADGDPAWASDGTRLAVAMRWPGSEGITVMDPDARSNRYPLTASPNDASPTWAPDHERIAFASGGDIAVVPSAGGAPAVLLTHGPDQDTNPAWSPDGRTIAFTRATEPGGGIWAIDVATGSETALVFSETYPITPSWSPRGELTYVEGAVAYLRAYDGTTSVLVPQVDWGSSIVWSPDGSQLLFVRAGRIRLADRTGTEIRTLAAGHSPAWQALPPGTQGCTLSGTASADLVVGTPGEDVLCGLGGNDTVLGLGGDDVLRGGAGNDWIAGGQGADRHYGDGGNDRLDSRDGNPDFARGGSGIDMALAEGSDINLGIERRRFDGNVAAWRPVTASGVTVPDPPERVVDGRADDYWNSGSWPPHWIEIDLLRPVEIGRIRVVTGPQPKGVTHIVLGRGGATRGAYVRLGLIRGPTAVFEQIVLKPRAPRLSWRGIRHVRVETVRHPDAGWVSWHEIEIYAARPR